MRWLTWLRKKIEQIQCGFFFNLRFQIKKNTREFYVFLFASLAKNQPFFDINITLFWQERDRWSKSFSSYILAWHAAEMGKLHATLDGLNVYVECIGTDVTHSCKQAQNETGACLGLLLLVI